MTVNERLVALGRMEAYERARAARHTREVERLLKEAHVDERSIQTIIEDL
jgi:hypothetical protein